MKHEFSLETFRKAMDTMIGSNETAFGIDFNHHTYGANRDRSLNLNDLSEERVQAIIKDGTLAEKRYLSSEFYDINSFYRRIILYYATLLKGVGLLVPNSSSTLSTETMNKKYNNAVNYLDKMQLPSLLTHCANVALVEGVYYGLVYKMDKNVFAITDLPAMYCRSNYKDMLGRDVVEFNITYFDTFKLMEEKENALKAYPKFFQKAYLKYARSKKNICPWVVVPYEMVLYLPFMDGCPPFLNTIEAALQYDEAVDVERDRDKDETKKIIVNQIPHLSDGALLFEPDEAEVMHTGIAHMLKNNKNVDVLTTYGEISAIVSKGNTESAQSTLEKMVNNIYYQAGTSGLIFGTTSNMALNVSLKNDLALMMPFVARFDFFVTGVINTLFGNTTLSFKYYTLPVSYYNDSDYVDTSLKMANSGYSFLVPAIAMGINQKDLISIKDLENNILQLGDKLMPLSTSYTQSGSGQVGRPSLPDDQKSEKTVANEESLNRQGTGG